MVAAGVHFAFADQVTAAVAVSHYWNAGYGFYFEVVGGVVKIAAKLFGKAGDFKVTSLIQNCCYHFRCSLVDGFESRNDGRNGDYFAFQAVAHNVYNMPTVDDFAVLCG